MHRSILLFSFIMFSGCAMGQSGKDEMSQLIAESFDYAAKQYQYMMTRIPKGMTPQSYKEKEDKFISEDIQWWCSGYYPGSLWYIYEQTGNEEIKKEAERMLELIKPNKDNTDNHDLGFMMFCSFGNGYRLTGKQEYKDVIFKTAASIATWYRPSIKAIQSWKKSQFWNCPVIIDNMMGLELLNWVTSRGGDKKYKDISINHANTTIRSHIRKNYSSFHVVDYDLNTGKIIRKATWQGAADCSAWARGQSWGLYGFTMMYRFTHDKKYLNLARNLAKFLLNHPNLPEDKIPFWDYDAPKIPFTVRDASAASIMVSALLELGQYTRKEEAEEYLSVARKILKNLCSEQYRAQLGENGGFLLKHSTGAYVSGSEIDVPLIYADYYFLEALKRYKEWYLK